ncbi:MAG: DUF3857 domain-containing protein [Lentimicrobium sp.]
MKNYLYLFPAVLILGISSSLTAISQNLAVLSIPENLSRGANSVVRSFSRTYTIPDENKLIIRETMSLTIMNEKALSRAHLSISYNEGEKVIIKTAAIYNEAGVKVKTIKKSEMADRSMVGDASLYTDARIIYYRVIPVRYPFTVVYDYEISYNSLYGNNLYSPYILDNQSIEMSELKVVNPNNIPLNIKSFNLPPGVSEIRSDFTRSWVFSNLPTIPEESMGPPAENFVPYIRIAPEVIQYENYKGKADTWENYGKFLAGLSTDRRDLSNATVANLTIMVSKASTTREKVSILYKYLQSRTHYINISLGIGGIQPHHASDVDELGYGDCKDLSNYMVAMLDAVGIKSYYTLVNAGEGKYTFEKDQPGHQFNHAIVCVPQESDTIWLECTNQVKPFGHLGSYTDNRPVLIIKDNSGVLARTPDYPIETNHINSKIEIVHNDEGTAATGHYSFSGLMMDEAVHIANQNKADQLDWNNSNLGMTDFTITSFKFIVNEAIKTTVELDVQFALRSFFTGSNGRFFASVNLNNPIEVPARVRNRKLDLYIPYSFRNADTVVVTLPAGYKPEQLPESTVSDERFGKYTMRSIAAGNKITCIRNFEMYAGTFPPEVYTAYYEFMQKAAVADSKQLVLIRE